MVCAAAVEVLDRGRDQRVQLRRRKGDSHQGCREEGRVGWLGEGRSRRAE